MPGHLATQVAFTIVAFHFGDTELLRQGIAGLFEMKSYPMPPALRQKV